LLISEVFGPTVQGEGPSAGQAAVFVRLGSCNLSCSWCDTGYTWDATSFDLASELHAMSVAEVARMVSASGVRLVVITGGEPALQAGETADLANRLRTNGHRVEIETNGTVPLGPLATAVDLIVVSPKLSNSGLREHQRLRPAILQDLADRDQAVFKFVVEADADLGEVAEIVDTYRLDSHRVWVMPEARSRDVLLRRLGELAQPVADRGWSLSGRLHVLLWGDCRGR
jgi:7-carboxy-7-deazaguanine synthase